MQPLDIQVIGEELAIKWNDREESFIRLEVLRRCCPCAACKGEMDVMGNLYKGPERPITAQACQLTRFIPVGNYAINLFWADGHGSGIYSFDYLKRMTAAAGQPPAQGE